jgi:hypothetical protein
MQQEDLKEEEGGSNTPAASTACQDEKPPRILLHFGAKSRWYTHSSITHVIRGTAETNLESLR